MSDMLTMLSFTTRRVPTVKKVIDDGQRMYECARFVIVLDEKAQVKESFTNPPFSNILVDCLVVLAPVTYKGKLVEKAVVFEIGFRRFVPYAQTEYLDKQSGKVKAIKPRIRVASLNENTLLALLPELCKGIQDGVHSILETWSNSELVWYIRSRTNDQINTASVFVKIPTEAKILCAAACFGEMHHRISEGGNLSLAGNRIKTICDEFMAIHSRSRTEQGDYLDETILRSRKAGYIAGMLTTRIKYRGYSEQMVNEMLGLVGKPGSKRRNLVEQIRKLYKVLEPPLNGVHSPFELAYKHMEAELVAGWHLVNFRSYRHEVTKNGDPRRKVHARNMFVTSVLGQEDYLLQVMDKRRASRTKEDDDIPF